MNNQASWVITKFLKIKKCDNLLVKPNNHRVNAAEWAIQTFKAHFTSALATTNSKFPLQLWDRLNPQVETTLNMLRLSQLDPIMVTYNALNGPYDWNSFPLAPLGCKAVIHKTPKSQESWASRDTDAWYIGPPMNHYQCNHFFIPKTQAYCVSGSTELFPQHCQVPFLMWNEHLQEIIDELVTTLHELPPELSGCILKLVINNLAARPPTGPPCSLTSTNHKWLLPPAGLQLAPYVPLPEQRVEQRVIGGEVDRETIHNDPRPVLTCITNAPPIMAAPNPTTKQALKLTKQTHSCWTRNNVRGVCPQSWMQIDVPLLSNLRSLLHHYNDLHKPPPQSSQPPQWRHQSPLVFCEFGLYLSRRVYVNTQWFHKRQSIFSPNAFGKTHQMFAPQQNWNLKLPPPAWTLPN